MSITTNRSKLTFIVADSPYSYLCPISIINISQVRMAENADNMMSENMTAGHNMMSENMTAADNMMSENMTAADNMSKTQ